MRIDRADVALIGMAVLWSVVAFSVPLAGRGAPSTVLVRPYFVVNIDTFAVRGSPHTHIQATGVVTLVRHEDDGDLHIRIAGPGGGWLVAECIPTLPCRQPKVGDTVTVRGISRRDPEHKWWEVHAVEELR